MTEAAPLFSFKDASLGYGKHPVLAGIDLEVSAGSFWGILGHNGSGKTTILKTVLGLIPVLKGRLDASGAPRFGYVPQKERLDPIYPLSARAVALMGTYRRLEFFGRPGAALVNRCLADCGAAGLADQRFSDLSGGQKQRVLIARALAAEPEVLVLDEPLAGIDATTQRSLIALLQSLHQDRKLTILMVSHRILAEKSLFTHIAWVEDGAIASGPAQKMLSRRHITEVFQSEL